MTKFFKYFSLFMFILSLPITIYSNVWLYQNRTNPISAAVQQDIDESVFKVVQGDAILTHTNKEALDPLVVQEGFSDINNRVDSDELDYTGSSLDNISAPEDIERIRRESTEPLYLRGYLIVPSVGIEERIMEGLGESALTYGVGTMAPESHPSQYGTYSLAGHNFGDWDYGTGLSKLQKYGTSLVGEKAYITYGDMVYEYVFVDVLQMFRDDSMQYTETDWNSRNLSAVIPQMTNDYQIIPGSQAIRPNDFYVHYDVNPQQNYNYGKLLTLYTCHVMPPDYRFSTDRIVARAVQVNSYPINQAPGPIQNYIVTDAWNPFVLTAHAASPSINESPPAESKFDQWLNGKLRKNPQFVSQVAIISSVITTVSLVTFIVLPGGRRREPKRS